MNASNARLNQPWRLACAVLACLVGSPAQAQQNQLDDDQTTACEVLMCLSTSKRPEQCRPPVEKFLRIQYRYLTDTLQARKNFLHLCPSTNQNSAMSAYADAVASGAGQCDAAALNGMTTALGGAGDSGEYAIGVSNRMPAYCIAYASSAFADLAGTLPLYVGAPGTGGFWANPPDYQAALARYAAARAAAASAGSNGSTSTGGN